MRCLQQFFSIFCLSLILLTITLPLSSVTQAQGNAVPLTPSNLENLRNFLSKEESDKKRWEEAIAVWNLALKQADQINQQLGSTMGASPQRSFARRATNLIFDKGQLRPINNQDQSLEANHYITIVYGQNSPNQDWYLEAFDNQAGGHKIASFSNGIEIEYKYTRLFEDGYVAHSAQAYRQDTLIATAEAVEKLTDTIPFQVKINESQNEGMQKAYTGVLIISLGEGGGVVKEIPQSGSKKFKVFEDWPSGR